MIIGTKSAYKNPWIEVIEDKVIRPDGKEGIFGTITMKDGVSVIPVDDKGNVYLTKEYHYAVGRITIEAVSGGIDNGETKLQAAKRELKEETGFNAKKWTDLGTLDPFTSVIKSENHMYLAQGLTKGKAAPEGTELIRVIKMPFKESLNMVKKSEITHGATVAALLKAKEYVK